MVNFLCKKPKIPEEVIKALFFLFANYYSRKLSFVLFEKIISSGSALNSLYLKFKFRFGNSKQTNKSTIDGSMSD